MSKQIMFVCVILAFVVLILPGGGVDAIKCYSCEGVNDNEDCNDEGTISCGGGESCYTVVERLESVGKIYNKGCLRTRTCERLENLNDPDICDFFPSECWYCCDGESKCNAYNSASTLTDSLTATLTSVLLLSSSLLLSHW